MLQHSMACISVSPQTILCCYTTTWTASPPLSPSHTHAYCLYKKKKARLCSCSLSPFSSPQDSSTPSKIQKRKKKILEWAGYINLHANTGYTAYMFILIAILLALHIVMFVHLMLIFIMPLSIKSAFTVLITCIDNYLNMYICILYSEQKLDYEHESTPVPYGEWLNTDEDQ